MYPQTNSRSTGTPTSPNANRHGQVTLTPQQLAQKQKEKGMAVVMTACMLLFTIPIVGLSIDAGLLFLVRARLSAACDAASLATARTMNLGQSLSEQVEIARNRGERFFQANFPNGYLGAQVGFPTVNVQLVNNSIQITTNASVQAPVYFATFIGPNASVTGAVGQANRKDINMMLVLDRSGSMLGTPCTVMKDSAKEFVNMFSNDRDFIGLITYGSSNYLVSDLRKDFKESGKMLTDQITPIQCGGWTNTSAAYRRAYDRLKAKNDPLKLNLIVLFTDGVPTAFSANVPVKTVTDTRFGYFNGPSGCSNPNNTCSMARTTCTDDNGRTPGSTGWGTFNPKAGVVAGGNMAAGTGDTDGLRTLEATSYSTSDPIIPSSQRTGCQIGSNIYAMRRDFAFIPDTDRHGLSIYGYMPVSRFTAGAYVNRARIDTPINVARVASNLADNAADQSRNDVQLPVTTFTIGLGSNGGVDSYLLQRMANVKELVAYPGCFNCNGTNPAYDEGKPEGMYYYSPDVNGIGDAFRQVASQILRISR